MIFTKYQSDNLGALSGTLCLIHCVATPFIFIVQSCSLTCCETAPVWWRFIDYFFLVISFFAVYQTTKNTTSLWIKPALWVSWSLLFLIILNEKLMWFPLSEYIIYFPALSLILLHIYNKKYCHCDINKCCANEK